MKILHINVLYYPLIGGGAEIILKNLVEGLHNLGHYVKVLSFWDKDDKEEIINGVSVYRAKIPSIYLPYGKKRPGPLKRRLWHLLDIYNPLAGKKIAKQIEDFKPDIIQIHNTQGWSSSIFDAVKRSDVPSIQVLHDLYLLCPTNMFKHNRICKNQCITCKLMRFPYKMKSNNLKAVVGVSNFILNKYEELGYFKDVFIKQVIYNSRNNLNTNINKSIEKSFINLGFIGTRAPNKGIELLLKAYQKIKKNNFRLFVAGTGKEDYENYLKTKYSDDSIVFMGRVEPHEFFSKVDVIIVPSIWYENFPGVVYESFAFGVPVIGSNIGGIPELIQEGVNGILFDPYKEGDLEEKLIKFVNEVDDWRNKTDIIKQSGQKFLDYEGWLKKWEELYLKVISIRD